MDGLMIAGVGTTGSGKTTQVTREGAGFKGPVLFFNPKGERFVPEGYVPINGSTKKLAIYRLIAEKRKISFQCDEVRIKKALTQLAFLVYLFMKYDKESMFIVDEAQAFAPQKLVDSPAIKLATQGRAYGINGRFTTQYPALLNKAIFVNCRFQRIFKFNEYSRVYYKRLGYDVKQLEKMIDNKGPFSYALMENGNILGVFDKDGY